MSSDPNRATNRWGDEDSRSHPAERDGNAAWFMWAIAIVLMLMVAGGGFTVYRARVMQERAAVEMARAEAAHQYELAQAAEKANKQKVSQPAKSSEEKKKFWPGMWLWGRDGKATIHIYSDGSREIGVPGLIECLKHEDPGIRECAAGWLGAIGRAAKEALPEIKIALNDPDSSVRNAAKDAIKRIESDTDSDD